MSTQFDTLATARRLEAAGIATKQAEAIVFAIQESRDTAATKEDLDSNVAALSSDLAANTAMLRSELEANTAALRSELEANMAALRSELEANTTALRSDLAAMAADLRAEIQGVATESRAERGKLRGELFRALWIQGAGVVGILLASKIF